MSDLLDIIGVFSVKQFDLLAKVLFDVLTDAHRLFRVDEIDSNAVLAESASSSNAMQVSLAIGLTRLVNGQIEIHNNVHLFNVDTARQNVRRDQHFLVTFAEAIQDSQSLIHGQVAAKHTDTFSSDVARHFP